MIGIIIARTNELGYLDIYPRGRPAGFVNILDDKNLLIGGLPGNNSIDLT